MNGTNGTGVLVAGADAVTDVFAGVIAPIAFTTNDGWDPTHDGTLVVHCSDPRFGPHNNRFIEQHLGVRQAVRVLKPGGPARILPGVPGCDVLIEDLRLHALKHDIRRVVGIAHGAVCGYYVHVLGECGPIPFVERQIDDLRRFQAVVREIMPDVEVETFYANPEGGTVVYRRIA